MAGTSLEYRISQLADGTLPAAEHAELQTRLNADALARQTFEEYQQLDRQLGRALVLPPLKWDALADQISAAVTEATERPAVIGRIAYSAPVWRKRLAVAASVLIAATAGLFAWHGRGNPGTVVSTREPSSAVAIRSSIVIGPQVEPTRGTASVQISVGPSPAIASQGGEWRYAEGVVTAPPKVQFFSKAGAPATDESPLH